MSLWYIIPATVAAIAAIMLPLKWKEIKPAGRILIILLIGTAIWMAVYQYVDYNVTQRLSKIDSTTGLIKDLDNKMKGIPVMTIGNSGAKFGLTNGIFAFEPFGKMVQLYHINNKLFVNVILFDTLNKVIAAIEGNEWEMVNKEYDYNDDETAFEVVTKGERKVVFQVELKNGVAHLSGLILNKQGLGIFFYHEPQREGATMRTFHESKNYNYDSIIIQKLFKYPRLTHHKEREF
jgi:hypothetical protein